MAPAVEGKLDAVVDQALAHQPVADAGIDQCVDGALLEQTCADARTQVVGRPLLQHDAVDAGEPEQSGKQQSGRAAADNTDLCAHDGRLEQERWNWNIVGRAKLLEKADRLRLSCRPRTKRESRYPGLSGR